MKNHIDVKSEKQVHDTVRIRSRIYFVKIVLTVDY